MAQLNFFFDEDELIEELVALDIPLCAVSRKAFPKRVLEKLETWSDQKIRDHFRVRSFAHLALLTAALGLDDENVQCGNGLTVPGFFALAVVLRRTAYPCRFLDMEDLLGKEKSELSRIFNATVDLIYDKHHHLLDSFDQPWLERADLDRYAAAIHEAGAGYDNCIGFIDGTARPICRPKGDMQRQTYSGHYGGNCMKFQSVVGPDGLLLNVWGPALGKRHDCYMLCESRIRQKIREKNLECGRDYCLFGDKGYPLWLEIQMPYKGLDITDDERNFNLEMSRLRLAVEYGFQKVSTLFAFGNYKQNQKLFLQQTGKVYLVSAILVNCLTCMYGFDLVGRRFRLAAPKLNYYLNGTVVPTDDTFVPE